MSELQSLRLSLGKKFRELELQNQDIDKSFERSVKKMKRRVRGTPSAPSTRETKTSSPNSSRASKKKRGRFHRERTKGKNSPSRMMSRRNKRQVIRIPSGPKDVQVHVHRSGSIYIDSRDRRDGAEHGNGGRDSQLQQHHPQHKQEEQQVRPGYALLNSPASSRSASPGALSSAPFAAAALSSADVSTLVGMEREWELRRLSSLSELQHEHEQSLNVIQEEVRQVACMVNETHHKGLEFIQEIIHVKARLEEEFASIWPHFLSGFKSTRTALQAFEMLAEEHKATLARKKELERENQHLKVKLKILIPKEVGILHEENEALRNEVKNLLLERTRSKNSVSEHLEKLEMSTRGSIKEMEEREEELSKSKLSLEQELMKATEENLLLRQRVNDMIFERKLFDAEKLKIQQAEKQRILSLQRALNEVSEQRDELRIEVEEKTRAQALRNTRPRRRAPLVPGDDEIQEKESPIEPLTTVSTRSPMLSTTAASVAHPPPPADIAIPTLNEARSLKSSLGDPHPAPKRRRRLSSVVRGVVNSSEESIARSAAIQSGAEEALATAKASMALFDAKQAEKAKAKVEIDEQLKEIAASVKEIVRSAEKSRVLETTTLKKDGNEGALLYDPKLLPKSGTGIVEAPASTSAALPGPPIPPLPNVTQQAEFEATVGEEEEREGVQPSGPGTEEGPPPSALPVSLPLNALPVAFSQVAPPKSPRDRMPSMEKIEDDLKRSRTPIERGNVAVDFFRRLSLEVSGDFGAHLSDTQEHEGDKGDDDDDDDDDDDGDNEDGNGDEREQENKRKEKEGKEVTSTRLSEKTSNLLRLLDEEQDLLAELQSASADVTQAFRSERGSVGSNDSAAAPALPEYPGSPFKPPEKVPTLPEIPLSLDMEGILDSSDDPFESEGTKPRLQRDDSQDAPSLPHLPSELVLNYPPTPSGGYGDIAEIVNGDETSTATNGATRKDGGDDPFAFLADASSIQQGKGTDAETEGNNELSCDIEAEIKAQRAEFAKAQASKGEEEKAASIKFGDFEITDLDGDGKIDSTDLLLRQLSGGDQLQKANTMARLPPPPPPPHHEQRRQIALAIQHAKAKRVVQKRRASDSDPLGLISPGKPKLAPKRMQSRNSEPALSLSSQLAQVAMQDSDKVALAERGGLDSSFTM